MDIERRTPGNTAIVLIDYVTGFANLFRSQSVQENVSGAVALAKTAIAGLMTEGCILHTTLGALRRDYTVSLVIDATAGESTAIHDAAVTRLLQLGVVPVSWLSFASELQRTYDNADTVGIYLDVQMQASGFAKNLSTLAARAQPATA